MRMAGFADGSSSRNKVVVHRNTRAACLASEHADRAANLQFLRIDTSRDFDRSIPGDLTFVFFNSDALIHFRIDVHFRGGLRAEWREQAIVGRALELDLRRLRSAGRLRERIDVKTRGGLSGDVQDCRLVGRGGREPRGYGRRFAKRGGIIELADDAGAKLRLGIEWIQILNLVLSPRGTDGGKQAQKGSEGVRQIGALGGFPQFDL